MEKVSVFLKNFLKYLPHVAVIEIAFVTVCYLMRWPKSSGPLMAEPIFWALVLGPFLAAHLMATRDNAQNGMLRQQIDDDDASDGYVRFYRQFMRNFTMVLVFSLFWMSIWAYVLPRTGGDTAWAGIAVFSYFGVKIGAFYEKIMVDSCPRPPQKNLACKK